MLELLDILPDRSDRIKFNAERFFINQSIHTAAQVPFNDYMNIDSQISEISRNIQNQEDSIINSISNLNRLLEKYNEYVFDDFILYDIIPLIIFHLPKEENDYSFFINFFLNFLQKIEKSNNIDLINSVVKPYIIEFLCEFLRESIKSQSNSYFLQKKTLKALLIILNHHESYSIFFTNPKFKLLLTIIFVFKAYLRYINGEQSHTKRLFNISELSKPFQDLFKSSIHIIDCFSLFFNILNEEDIKNNLNSIKVITNLLIDATFSHCIQINNESMASLLTCSERFPKIFYQCVHQSHKEEDFISLIDPTEFYDESTHLLALDIIVFITKYVPDDEIIEIISKTPIMSHLLALLSCNLDKFILPATLIIINFILKSSLALKTILIDGSKIIQNILQHFTNDLRNKEKLAIFYLFSSCVISLDDKDGETFLPYFIEISSSNSLFDELIEGIVSTQSNDMILFTIQSIVRLLDFSFTSRNSDYVVMMDAIIKILLPEQVFDISEISEDHKFWASKLTEMIESYQASKNET